MMRMVPGVLAIVVGLAAPAAASGQAVFVVRHAERADSGSGTATMMASDPELSAAGRARAETLAAMLRDVPVTAIFVTQYKRTQQTAGPLARALGITPSVVSARDVSALVAAIKSARGHVLVVGHSNTVGDVIAALGVNAKVAVEDHEYDNLFVVTGGALLRLRYGVGVDRQ